MKDYGDDYLLWLDQYKEFKQLPKKWQKELKEYADDYLGRIGEYIEIKELPT